MYRLNSLSAVISSVDIGNLLTSLQFDYLVWHTFVYGCKWHSLFTKKW